MSKMPLGYRFRAWLLSYWFGSFEGGMVRDTWMREGQRLEQERIIKAVLEYKVELDLEGATDRDKMAMAHAIWVFRHGLAKVIKGENMAAIRADRNRDIAQQEYADFSNPLIKDEEDCVCRPEGQCLYHKALAKVEGENK